MFNHRYLFLGSQINWDTSYLSKKLSQLALQGWQLTHVGTVLTFKRAQPQHLKFEIDYLDANMTWASSEEPFIVDYRQICEQSGWTYCGNTQNLFIFSAPMEADLIPLQTDEELKRKTLISLGIKSMWYPIFLMFISLLNGLTPKNYQLLTYSSTLLFILNWIVFIGSFIYFMLNLLQILSLKRCFKHLELSFLPSLIRNFLSGFIFSIIGLLILTILPEIFAGTSSGVIRAIFLMIILLGCCSYLTNLIIRKPTFTRKKKIILSIFCIILTIFLTLHGIIYVTFSTVIAEDANLELEFPILNESPFNLSGSQDVFLDRSSSFVFSDYISFSHANLNFDFYQLRSQKLNHIFDELISEERSRSYQSLQVNTEHPFMYDIIDADSNELIGYILYDELNFLKINLSHFTLELPEAKESILKLFKQFSSQ